MPFLIARISSTGIELLPFALQIIVRQGCSFDVESIVHEGQAPHGATADEHKRRFAT